MEGGPEVVVNELRGWLDDMLHRLLTASMVWACLVHETVSPDDFLLTTRPVWPPRQPCSGTSTRRTPALELYAAVRGRSSGAAV